jgi:hypothetical protein
MALLLLMLGLLNYSFTKNVNPKKNFRSFNVWVMGISLIFWIVI